MQVRRSGGYAYAGVRDDGGSDGTLAKMAEEVERNYDCRTEVESSLMLFYTTR